MGEIMFTYFWKRFCAEGKIDGTGKKWESYEAMCSSR